MSQRNPMNDRYTDENKGKTRKSAASAKPKAKAAASVRMQGSAPAKPTREQKKEAKAKRHAEDKSKREFESRNYRPDTPQYKNWRKIWWVSVGVAGAMLLLSFFIQNNYPEQTTVYVGILILCYASMIFGLWIEFWKLRKMRNEHYENLQNRRLKETRRAEKEQIKAEKQAKADAEAGIVNEKSSKFSLAGLKKLTKKNSDSDAKE